MEKEAEEQIERSSIEFKNLAFVHAYMAQNPKLYDVIYPREGLTPQEEEELEWEIPQTEEDVMRMMAELAEVMG
jgi:hypothetical protein